MPWEGVDALHGLSSDGRWVYWRHLLPAPRKHSVRTLPVVGVDIHVRAMPVGDVDIRVEVSTDGVEWGPVEADRAFGLHGFGRKLARMLLVEVLNRADPLPFTFGGGR